MIKCCHFTVSCSHHQESMGAWSDERSHSSGIRYVVSMLVNDCRVHLDLCGTLG